MSAPSAEDIAEWHETMRLYYEKMAAEREAACRSTATADIAADVHAESYRYIVGRLEVTGPPVTAGSERQRIAAWLRSEDALALIRGTCISDASAQTACERLASAVERNP